MESVSGTERTEEQNKARSIQRCGGDAVARTELHHSACRARHVTAHAAVGNTHEARDLHAQDGIFLVKGGRKHPGCELVCDALVIWMHVSRTSEPEKVGARRCGIACGCVQLAFCHDGRLKARVCHARHESTSSRSSSCVPTRRTQHGGHRPRVVIDRRWERVRRDTVRKNIFNRMCVVCAEGHCPDHVIGTIVLPCTPGHLNGNVARVLGCTGSRHKSSPECNEAALVRAIANAILTARALSTHHCILRVEGPRRVGNEPSLVQLTEPGCRTPFAALGGLRSLASQANSNTPSTSLEMWLVDELAFHFRIAACSAHGGHGCDAFLSERPRNSVIAVA